MKSAAEKASSWIMEMEKILRGQMWCNGSSAGMDVIFSVRGAVSSPHYRPDDVTSDDESTQRYMTHTSCWHSTDIFYTRRPQARRITSY